MRYRASGTPPRGRWARFLQAQRQKRGWSQTRAFEELRDGLNLGPKSRASYVNMDLGNREPRPEEADFLTRYFGEAPEEEQPAPAADLSALVAAIDRQTEAISALLARFDSLASEAIRRGVDAAVAEAAERRAGGGLRPEPHSQQFG